MNKYGQVLSACVLVLLIAVPAASDCRPVVGHFEANLVLPGQGHCPNVPDSFCTAGRVWGGIQGTYRFVMTGAFPAGAIAGTPSVLFFTGQSTVSLKSGSDVVGTDTGSIDLPQLGGQGGFASLITFGPGSQIRLRGEFSPASATTSGDYIGTYCTP